MLGIDLRALLLVFFNHAGLFVKRCFSAINELIFLVDGESFLSVDKATVWLMLLPAWADSYDLELKVWLHDNPN